MKYRVILHSSHKYEAKGPEEAITLALRDVVEKAHLPNPITEVGKEFTMRVKSTT